MWIPKPCPFCGEKEDEEYEWEMCMDDISIRCLNCGALGPPCSTLNEARKSWNERKEAKEDGGNDEAGNPGA